MKRGRDVIVPVHVTAVRQTPSQMHHGLVAAHTIVVIVWTIGYFMRYLTLDYGNGVAGDMVYYTNWNYLATGLFFWATVLSLTCASALDTPLHFLLLPVVWGSNAITFFGHIPVVASNGDLMNDGETPWSVVYAGDKIVHVFICMWLFAYTVWRLNDLRWIWHAHGALDFAVLMGRNVCVPLCTAMCFTHTLRDYHVPPFGSGAMHVEATAGSEHHDTAFVVQASHERAMAFAFALFYQGFLAPLSLPAIYLALVRYEDAYSVSWLPHPIAALFVVTLIVVPCVALLLAVIVGTPPWEVRVAAYSRAKKVE